MTNRKEQALELKIDADKLYKKELYNEAIKLYTQSIESDPLLINAYLGITKCHIRTNSINTASSFFEKTLKVADPERITNIKKGIAGVFFNTNNPTEAFNVFETIYQKTNNIEEQKLGLKYLIASNEIEKAIEDINTKFNNQPNILTELLLGDYLTSEQKNKLANQQGDIIGSIKKQMLPLIDTVNRQLTFISEKTSDFPLISNWNNVLQSFNEAKDISEILTLKEELQDLKNKVEIEYQVYSATFQKEQIDELLTDKGINRETLASLTKEFVLMVNLLDKNQDSDLKQKSVTFYENYKSQFKTPLGNNDFNAVTQNFEYVATLHHQYEAVKTKLFATVNTFIENKKYDDATQLIEKLLKIFPNSEELTNHKATIKANRGKRNKKIIIGVIILIISVCLLIFYTQTILPKQKEEKAWAAALANEYFDDYINNFPEGKHIEEAYIERIKTCQRTFFAIVNLNLRDKSNKEGKVLAVVQEGETMTFLEAGTKNETAPIKGVNKTAPFFKVKYKDKEGWVFGSGFKTDEDALTNFCEEYLRLYPNGSFVEKAEKAINTINRNREEELWQEIMKGDEMEKLDNVKTYLYEFWEGKYAKEAKEIKKELEILKELEVFFEGKEVLYQDKLLNFEQVEIPVSKDILGIYVPNYEEFGSGDNVEQIFIEKNGATYNISYRSYYIENPEEFEIKDGVNIVSRYIEGAGEKGAMRGVFCWINYNGSYHFGIALANPNDFQGNSWANELRFYEKR